MKLIVEIQIPKSESQVNGAEVACRLENLAGEIMDSNLTGNWQYVLVDDQNNVLAVAYTEEQIGDDGKEHEFRVIAGNVGCTYIGPSELMARRKYDEYCEKSITGQGRSSGENVSLFIDDEMIEQYQGANPQDLEHPSNYLHQELVDMDEFRRICEQYAADGSNELGVSVMNLSELVTVIQRDEYNKLVKEFPWVFEQIGFGELEE